jgi:hypothetical protein
MVSGCCPRLVAEWRLAMWSVADTNGKSVDVVASFQPKPHALMAIVKLAFLSWVMSIWITDMIEYDSKGFWYAYLTHWGLLATIVYFTLSLCTLMIFSVVQTPLNFVTRFLWGLFTTIVTVETVIALLFWVLEYKAGPVSYGNVVKHGVFLILLWIDGFLINRIPIRFKQIVFPYIFLIIFLLWSGIHSVTKIGNPNITDKDHTTDDDAIYSAVSWNHRPEKAAITGVTFWSLLFHVFFQSIGFFQSCRFVVIWMKYRYGKNQKMKRLIKW